MVSHFFAKEIGEVFGSFIPGRNERTGGEENGFMRHTFLNSKAQITNDKSNLNY